LPVMCCMLREPCGRVNTVRNDGPSPCGQGYGRKLTTEARSRLRWKSYGEPRARRRPCTEARQRWPVRQPDQCAVLTRCKGRRRSPKSDSSSSPSNRRANGGRPPTFWKAPSPNNPTCEPEVGFRQSQRFRRRLCRHERPGASQARDRSRRRRRAQHSDGGATRYGIQILCWVRD